MTLTDTEFGIIFKLIELVFYGLILGSVYYFLWYLPARRLAAYKAFSKAHGFEFFGKRSKAGGYLGFLPGNSSYVIRGVDEATKREVRLFQLIYVVGSGRDKKTYNRTVVEVSIKPSKAHIFVNSRVNDATEQISLDKSQRYIAEGDFGKYFDIYTAGNDHINTLALFAPDVMSLIMANFGYYDIEVVSDRVYVYDYKLTDTEQGLEDFFQKGLALAKELDSNAPRKLAFQKTQEPPADSAITALKSGNPIWPIFVVIAFVVFYAVASFVYKGSSPGMSVVRIVAVTGPNSLLLLWAVFYAMRNKKRELNYLQDRKDFVMAHPVPGVKKTDTPVKT